MKTSLVCWIFGFYTSRLQTFTMEQIDPQAQDVDLPLSPLPRVNVYRKEPSAFIYDEHSRECTMFHFGIYRHSAAFRVKPARRQRRGYPWQLSGLGLAISIMTETKAQPQCLKRKPTLGFSFIETFLQVRSAPVLWALTRQQFGSGSDQSHAALGCGTALTAWICRRTLHGARTPRLQTEPLYMSKMKLCNWPKT